MPVLIRSKLKTDNHWRIFHLAENREDLPQIDSQYETEIIEITDREEMMLTKLCGVKFGDVNTQLNVLPAGGFPVKTLDVFLAGTGVGKTMMKFPAKHLNVNIGGKYAYYPQLDDR